MPPRKEEFYFKIAEMCMNDAKSNYAKYQNDYMRYHFASFLQDKIETLEKILLQ